MPISLIPTSASDFGNQANASQELAPYNNTGSWFVVGGVITLQNSAENVDDVLVRLRGTAASTGQADSMVVVDDAAALLSQLMSRVDVIYLQELPTAAGYTTPMPTFVALSLAGLFVIVYISLV